MKASEILCEDGPKYKQIEREYGIGDCKRCAAGVLVSRYGWTPDKSISRYMDRATEELGLDEDKWCEIIDLNDKGKTFKQIATWLKRRGL